MKISTIVTLVVSVLCLAIFFLMWLSYSNQEVDLRTRYDATFQNVATILDTANKKISGTAQVTQVQMQSIKDIIVGNAEARAQQGKGSLAAMVTEAVPNVDTSTFKNLQNIISSARDQTAQEQLTAQDIAREYNRLIGRPVGHFFLCSLGSAKPIKYVPITSTRTQDAMQTRRDDDGYNAFPVNKPAEAK